MKVDFLPEKVYITPVPLIKKGDEQGFFRGFVYKSAFCAGKSTIKLKNPLLFIPIDTILYPWSLISLKNFQKVEKW